jgi:hypothetical protein
MSGAAFEQNLARWAQRGRRGGRAGSEEEEGEEEEGAALVRRESEGVDFADVAMMMGLAPGGQLVAA